MVQPGLRGKLAMPGFGVAHAGALAVKIFTVGLKLLGSSSEPTLIATTVGIALSNERIGDPQSAQKPRLTLLPLSAVTSKCFNCPLVNLKAALGTKTTGANAPPVAC